MRDVFNQTMVYSDGFNANLRKITFTSNRSVSVTSTGIPSRTIQKMEIHIYRLVVLLTFFALTAGLYHTPCHKNADCGEYLGLSCHRLYHQCKKGVCRCLKGTFWDFSAKKCLKLRKLGEACDPWQHSCAVGAACMSGTCKCREGSPAADNLGCRLMNERFIGEECDSNMHKCYVYSMGFKIGRSATCDKGICNCTKGESKASGHVCLDLVVGDKGCSHKTCRGSPGSVCIDGKCRCSAGKFYHQVKKTCISSQATRNLPAGARCNETSDTGPFCGNGLFCGSCPGENSAYTCMRMAPPGHQFVAQQVIDGKHRGGVSRMSSGGTFWWTVALLLPLRF